MKIGDVLSDWSQLSAGVPQGSYLGPLMFIIVIDALQPGCLTHKYVDDTTMTEFLSRSAVSSMQLFVDELVQQATDVGMIVNGRKTKELLIGSVVKDPPPPVNLSGTLVERVTTFKLLGVHVASDLKWTQHIDAITSKAVSRLHFLKQLKRSGAGGDDLLYFYVTVIRTVPWQHWCVATGPRNLHFMIEYINNAKAYKLQNRHISSKCCPGHMTQFGESRSKI